MKAMASLVRRLFLLQQQKKVKFIYNKETHNNNSILEVYHPYMCKSGLILTKIANILLPESIYIINNHEENFFTIIPRWIFFIIHIISTLKIKIQWPLTQMTLLLLYKQGPRVVKLWPRRFKNLLSNWVTYQLKKQKTKFKMTQLQYSSALQFPWTELKFKN